MKRAIFIIAALLMTTVAMGASFPITPAYPNGDLCNTSNRDFHEYRYREGIPYCIRNVTSKRKAQIYKAFGIPKQCRRKYTIDHTIPLSLGGSNSNQNLWPEHKAIKALRHNLELQLYQQISHGLISQEDAVKHVLYSKSYPPLEYINLNPNDACDN